VKHLIAMTVLAHCMGAQLACADSPSAPTQRVVHFNDLNLAHTEGVAALYQRLRAAAGETCSLPDERTLERGRRFQACVDDALSVAVSKVDEPALSSYYQAQLDGRRTLVAGTSRRPPAPATSPKD
jgi:UrcA family protein